MAANGNGNVNLPSRDVPTVQLPRLSLATRSVHADDPMNTYTDVAPALHVSTTFRYNDDPDKLKPFHGSARGREAGGPVRGDQHIYSRDTAPNMSRLELLLTSVLGVPCLTYASGIASFHALLIYLRPNVVAIGGGYHGCHGTLGVYQKLTGCEIVNLLDPSTWDGDGFKLGPGDVVHIETPLNPYGTACNIQEFADLAHARGAYLTVDSTFAPPPLQDPFKQGADFVMHSGTKYIGGHSDMLCGIIAIGKNTADWEKHYWGMFDERLYLGSTLGNMEGWLGVRSLRTLDLRVTRQSETATKLVKFVYDSITGADQSSEAAIVKAVVKDIKHASLQKEDMAWLKKQMPGGFGPVFMLETISADTARWLPSKLELFHHATSLGGVESLIEWRSMTDPSVADTVLRVSIGVEGFEDLKADLVAGCKALA